MITLLYSLYVFVCVFLILVVLLQAGKGGMGAAFGGSSQTVFGSSGAGNFLTRLTVVSAALFMLLSATLTYVSSSGEQSFQRASEKIRLREEARSAASKDGKGTKAAAPAPAGQSTPEGAANEAPAPSPTAPTAPVVAVPSGNEVAVPQDNAGGGTPIKVERVDPNTIPALKAKIDAQKAATVGGGSAPIKLERVDPKDVPGATPQK
ncbi:MAG TPA: preprotein translocase subunit SecG [Polyangiales bacterium]|jgi:preprotein translocase subunit SecG|nr:preprotein translocase subunit SecG [Polyangiales bacterium]